MSALVDKTAKRPLPRPLRHAPRKNDDNKPKDIAISKDGNDSDEPQRAKYNLHDALKCVNAQVRRAFDEDRSDPDLDVAASYVEEATHKSIEEWAQQLGFKDWVELFANLSCVDRITWLGDQRGWTVVPAAPRPYKLRGALPEGLEPGPDRVTYDTRALGSPSCASRPWKVCWLRAIVEAVDRVFHQAHASRLATMPAPGKGKRSRERLAAPVVVGVTTLGAHVQQSTCISPYRWVQYLGYANWNALLIDLPCVASLHFVPSPRDPEKDTVQKEGAWMASSHMQWRTPSGIVNTAIKATKAANDIPAAPSLQQCTQPGERIVRNGQPGAPVYSLPLKLVMNMGASLAVEQKSLAYAAVWVTTLEACRAAVATLQAYTHIAVHCIMSDDAYDESPTPGRRGRRNGIDIIQVTGADGKGPCFFFDLWMCDDEGRCTLLIDSGLKDLLQNPSIIKVMRNAHAAAERLLCVHLVDLDGILDVDHEPAGGDSGGGAAQSEGTLFADRRPPLDVTVTRAVALDPYVWRQRPLPEWMIAHMVGRVHALCKAYTHTVPSSPEMDWNTTGTIKHRDACGEGAEPSMIRDAPFALDGDTLPAPHEVPLDNDDVVPPLDDIPLPSHVPTAPFPPHV